jgi:hypothetical protein
MEVLIGSPKCGMICFGSNLLAHLIPRESMQKERRRDPPQAGCLMLRHLSRLSLYIVHMCLKGHLRSKLLDHKLSSSSFASESQNHSSKVPPMLQAKGVPKELVVKGRRPDGLGT